MTANEVWIFKPLTATKVELVGRMPPKDTDPTKLPGASHDAQYEEHTLLVRTMDGFAEKCRTCDVIGLVPGQLCMFIDKYNDEKHPL